MMTQKHLDTLNELMRTVWIEVGGKPAICLVFKIVGKIEILLDEFRRVIFDHSLIENLFIVYRAYKRGKKEKFFQTLIDFINQYAEYIAQAYCFVTKRTFYHYVTLMFANYLEGNEEAMKELLEKMKNGLIKANQIIMAMKRRKDLFTDFINKRIKLSNFLRKGDLYYITQDHQHILYLCKRHLIIINTDDNERFIHIAGTVYIDLKKKLFADWLSAKKVLYAIFKRRFSSLSKHAERYAYSFDSHYISRLLKKLLKYDLPSKIRAKIFEALLILQQVEL
mgnify:CR=1 FL=1